jgi:nucleoside-diphosphate kinase
MERVLVVIKPDGIEKALIGTVIQRFEQCGLKVVALKMLKADAGLVGRHYVEDKDWMLDVGKKAKKSAMEKGETVTETELEIGQRVRNALIRELTRTPVVAFVMEGNAAAEIARKITGGTEPRKADPGTIRGMYSSDSYALADKTKRSVRNIIHVSENAQIAEKEIAVWFKESEIATYRRADEQAMYG